MIEEIKMNINEHFKTIQEALKYFKGLKQFVTHSSFSKSLKSLFVNRFSDYEIESIW